jgi:glycosyltransferase involved in cell wall biosynthesis
MHPPAVLTVIVPCYNVAPFVATCLRSVFRQPQAGRLKVLVVDDGSGDGTGDVVRAEIAAHPHVDCELARQPNQGPSCVRNNALVRVGTPYVTFLDADDFWAEAYLDKVLPLLDAGRADIVGFNARFVHMDGRRIHGVRSHSPPSTHAPRSTSELAVDAARVGEWHSCTRIFRTGLLRGVGFPPGRYYEDAALLPLLYVRASHIEALDEELYAYRRRPGSITNVIGDKHIDDLLLAVREASARIAEWPEFWTIVLHGLLLRVAGNIGRAPRALRPAMVARAWPHARTHLDRASRMRWMACMLDAALRTETKAFLRAARVAFPSPRSSGASHAG